jgi:hypothetical protein
MLGQNIHNIDFNVPGTMENKMSHKEPGVYRVFWQSIFTMFVGTHLYALMYNAKQNVQ